MMKLLSALISAAALGGCATVVPDFDIPKDASGAPTVRSIVDEVTCELSRMVENPEYSDILLLGDVQVVILLDLTVNDSGGLSPSFTYSAPPFSFDGGFTLNQSRSQEHTEKLFYSMRTLSQEIKIAHQNGARFTVCDHSVDTNLAGNLGLKEAVDLARRSPHLNWSDKDNAFGGSVEFVVTKSLDKVGPTWTLKHFTGPGGFASLSEVNTDKIDFSFARGESAGKAQSARSKAETLLDQITLNQISTRLNFLRGQVQ